MILQDGSSHLLDKELTPLADGQMRLADHHPCDKCDKVSSWTMRECMDFY